MSYSARRMSSIDLKIVVLGSAYVGKTSIINRYCNGCFLEETMSTIGAGFFTNILKVNDSEVTSMIWDTAGEERFRSVAPSLLRGANGLVLVYDQTQPTSFNDIDIYMDMFLDTCKSDPSMTLPVLLLGNKSDLESHIPQDDVEEWKRRNKVVYNSNVSAKTGEGIQEALENFIKALVNPEMSSDPGPLKITLSPCVKKEKESCC